MNTNRNVRLCAAMLVLGLFVAEPVSAQEAAGSGATERTVEHPLVPAIKIAKSSLEGLNDVKDYESVLIKREVVDGRLLKQKMLLKVREEPFSVYLKFIEPNQGRELLYVTGANENNALVHEGSGIASLVGTVKIKPNGKEVMAENRYPLTQIGLRKLLKTVIAQWESETKYAETDVMYYKDAKLGSTPCYVIESSHPQPRKGFRFHLTRLYIDKATKLPVRLEQYGFPRQQGGEPPLVEEYTYSALKTNVGLTNVAFSTQNPKYAF